MPLVEFYVRPGGSPLNAGSTNTNSPSHEFTSGSWDSTTGVFTLGSGTTSGVSVGDYASIYPDGSSETGCICRISALTSTTLTLQIAKVVGALPTSGTGNRTVRVGGAWASVRNIITLANWGRLGNVLGNDHFTRINVQNGSVYAENTAISGVSPGGLNDGRLAIVQGFSTTPGDGGKATLQGAATGSAYTVLSVPGHTVIADLIIDRNGSTGSATLVAMHSFLPSLALRCWFTNSRGDGVADGTCVLCYSGSNLNRGFFSTYAYRCVATNNTNEGFTVNTGLAFECIAEGNGRGFSGGGGSGCNHVIRCASIRNGTDTDFRNRPDGTGVFWDCVAIKTGGAYAFSSEQGAVAAVVQCGSTGHTNQPVAPMSAGSQAILPPLILNLRTLTSTPFTSAPTGGFPKSIDLRPTPSGGAQSVAAIGFDVPSSVYSAIEAGFAQATPTPSNVGGSAAVDPLGGGLVI